MGKRFTPIGAILLLTIILAGCGGEDSLSVDRETWGYLSDGRPVSLYTLENARDVTVQISNYGGTLVSVQWPDANGRIADVLLGYYDLEGFLENNPYFGGIIGRYANRIDEGMFTLNGQRYTLATNDGPNHLHGGEQGFDKRVWDTEPITGRDSVGVRLRYVSPDMEEGYPGELTNEVTYTLNNRNELRLEYAATTTEPTIVNLTNHPYWNLAGQGNGKVLDHRMMINANQFTPIDSTLIPSGEIRDVAGTPFDFREPTAIGARINQETSQLRYGNGYDHNWVLNKSEPGVLTLACRVSEHNTGRVLEIYTTEPGLQFYSGNFLDGSITGKNNEVYEYREALVLEAQHFPDSPNHPDFPSTVLEPGEHYTQTTIYKFLTDSNERNIGDLTTQTYSVSESME